MRELITKHEPNESRVLIFATHYPPAPPFDFDDALHSAAKPRVFLESTIVSFDTDVDATDIIHLTSKDIPTHQR